MSTDAIPMTASEAFALAVRHHQAGRAAEAEQVYRSILKAAPRHAGANHNLGTIALSAGHLTDACALMARAVRSAPDVAQFREGLRKALESYLAAKDHDAIGARAQLAALGAEPTPARATAEHMRALYAGRASDWPPRKGYRAPELVAKALLARITTPADILDAGCGNGLVGALVRPIARRLVGVDLSEEMVAVARERGQYDELHVGDLVDHLEANPRTYDAIAGAAILIHFGDLSAPLAAAARALRPCGVIALTLFPNEQDPNGYGVQALDAAEGGVFFHGRRYIEAQLAAAGLHLQQMSDEIHESKDHAPFMGLLVVASA